MAEHSSGRYWEPVNPLLWAYRPVVSSEEHYCFSNQQDLKSITELIETYMPITGCETGGYNFFPYSEMWINIAWGLVFSVIYCTEAEDSNALVPELA